MSREQVNIICDALWDFHNARLEDPELHTMDKYVQPILALIDSATREARLEELKALPQLIQNNEISGLPNPLSNMDKISLQDIRTILSDRRYQLQDQSGEHDAD